VKVREIRGGEQGWSYDQSTIVASSRFLTQPYTFPSMTTRPTRLSHDYLCLIAVSILNTADVNKTDAESSASHSLEIDAHVRIVPHRLARSIDVTVRVTRTIRTHDA
jgi:hypothetical protein